MAQTYDLRRLNDFMRNDSKTFRLIKSIDYHDYNESWPLAYRISARAIIQEPSGQYLMEYMPEYDCYTFPGGGVEDGETLEQALIREIREESGFAIDKGSIRRYGQIVLKKSNRDYASFNQRYIGISLYFKATSLGKQFATDMTDSEKRHRMTTKFVRLDDAIRANEIAYNRMINSADKDTRINSEFILRETIAMKDLRDNSTFLGKESVDTMNVTGPTKTIFRDSDLAKYPDATDDDLEIARGPITNKPYLDTPCKVISRMYDELKKNYTKQGAIQFYNYYSALNLSDILDVSCASKIISEPYKGYDFMYQILSDATYVPLHYMKPLLSSVQAVFSKAIADPNISYEQAAKLSNASLSLQSKLGGGLMWGCVDDLIHTILPDDEKEGYYNWVSDAYDKFYKGTLASISKTSLLNNLHEKKLKTSLAYFPEILRLSVGIKDASAVYNMIFNTALGESPKPTDPHEVIYAKVLFARMLRQMAECTAFIHLIERLPDKIRFKLKEIENTDYEVLDDRWLVTHESVNDIVMASPVDFMESMVDHQESNQYLLEECNSACIENLMFEKAVLEATRDFETLEYAYSCEDWQDPDSVEDSVSSKLKLESIRDISIKCEKIEDDLRSLGVVFEFQDNGEASDVINKSMGIDPDKPDQGSLARRVQNKAIDTDIKAKKAAANAKKSAQQTRNTAKAITKVPREATDLVSKRIKEWDDLDDERRKKYMIKPGFRKKYWKALKIAIAHGLAFKISPILNIILLVAHYVSGKKDVRIRNELVQELDTEIKVLEQKIEDAKGNGDRQASYKLMRMKDKLLNERNRVAANSKFI